MQAGWRQASVFSVGRLGLALCTEQGGRPHAAARERRCADLDCRARARGLHAFGEVLQTNLRPSRFVTRPSHTVTVHSTVTPLRPGQFPFRRRPRRGAREARGHPAAEADGLTAPRSQLAAKKQK